MHRDLLGYSGLVASGVGTHSLFRQPTTYEHQWHEPCLSTMYDAASCLPVTTTLPACHLILLPPAPPDYQGTHYSLFTVHSTHPIYPPSRLPYHHICARCATASIVSCTLMRIFISSSRSPLGTESTLRLAYRFWGMHICAQCVVAYRCRILQKTWL